MGTVAGTIAVIGLILGAVGTGVSYAAQTSAAKNSALFASLNAEAGLQQTKAQGRAQALQAELKAASEGAAQRSASNNAESMRKQADAQIRVDQENIRKQRLGFQRQMASVRAARANSGVIDTSASPLDLLVNASEDETHLEQEMGWSADNNRRKGYRQAQIEENQGRAHGINAGLAQIDGMAAVEAARMQGTQIRLNKFGAIASSQGDQMAAFGSLLGSVGGLGTSASNYNYYRTPRGAA